MICNGNICLDVSSNIEIIKLSNGLKGRELNNAVANFIININLIGGIRLKKSIVIILCLIIIFNLSACAGQSKEGDVNSTSPTSIPGMNVKEYNDVDTSSAVATLNESKGLPIIEKYDLRQLLEVDYINSVNEFSKQVTSLLLKGQKGNAMISPISIQMALSLAGVGAEGTTREEILTSLGMKDKGVDYVSEQNANMYQLLYTDNELGKLSIANSLWLKKDMVFQEDYVKRASEDFYSSLYLVDFSDETTATLMSKWIWENTGKLLSPQINLNPEQILSIINTIYFKDEWITAFSEEATAPEEFNLIDGTKITCDFMNMTLNNQEYVKGDNFISMALPLKNLGRMHFILPQEGVTVDDLLQEPDQITEVLQKQESEYAKILLQLPKFSFGSTFKLKEAMKAMGITSAFQTDANFHGITEEGAAFISDIEHQTHIGIDEKGVEAAAFTNIMYAGSALLEDKKLIEMTLDRPFIFVITEEDVILFIGIVNNPLAK